MRSLYEKWGVFVSVCEYKWMIAKCNTLQALHFAERWGSQFSRLSVHEHGCQPYAPAAFTMRGWVNPAAIVGLEGVKSIKKFRWHRRESNPLSAGL